MGGVNVTIREQLVSHLTENCPADWKVVDTQRNVDRLEVPTVALKQSTIDPLSEAPNGRYKVGYTITIVSPDVDIEAAEYDLDDCVFTLLQVIDGLKWLSFETAKKVAWDDRHAAYDITANLITKKDNS